MSKTRRISVPLALSGVLASLIVYVSSGTAAAAESVPELQWPPVTANADRYPLTTSPQGDVTIGCGSTHTDSGLVYQDVVTYGAAGTETRHLDHVNNCLNRPVVDKVGDLYGAANASTYLQAYHNNVEKWRYQVNCSGSWPVVGADGNIYVINSAKRLIGLSPEVEPGQTQPKKVLDIPALGRCGDQLRATTFGIAVIWDYGTKVNYYTYGGKNLGAPQGAYTGDLNFPMDADGLLFYPTWVGSGSTASFKVSAYNPLTKTVKWTASESTFGNGASPWLTFPTPGGGAVVWGQRQKMVGGVPTVPSEYMQVMFFLNSVGQKIKEIELPKQNSAGDLAGNNYVTVDTSGKLVLVRDWKKYLTFSPYNVPYITIDVFSAYNGDVLQAPKVMSGNSDNTQGEVYGYKIKASTASSTIGPGTLYIPAQKCAGGCTGSSIGNVKVYPVKITGLGLDYPRGAVIETPPWPASPYVALGDSFSSGEGVPPFESGTDETGLNTCHRSTAAYARLIAGTSAKIPPFGTNGFRACSGAVTDNVWDLPQANEGIQIGLNPDPTIQLVTISIGGNDMGFSDFATQCVISTCDVGSAAYNTALNKINNEIPGKLETTYKKILQYAPNAKIYVVGYPQVIADKPVSAPDDIRCVYMQDGATRWGDARAARDIVQKLNEKISQKIFELRALSTDNTRLRFVFMNDPATSPFVGREICGVSTTSYFQNVDQINPDRRYIFHPNQLGQNAYATIVGGTINASS
ncbi:SGNH/GDSL hydrolase family protein [Kribbella sp. NBC_01245]|uniref:SGNH/GDSL hydrolase family protein n=1 Tax=Kribbella sp. NBC_01245 TaxID=2903578 RepID=UPI002E285D51|nr:SGNH/GDSL hydrolase family protein [Kribbella sp. NBC_01245]